MSITTKNMETIERKEDLQKYDLENSSPKMKTCRPKLSMSKMFFITNAIENGWTVKKKNGYYVFSKKHENKKKYFQKNYLDEFVHSNLV